MNATLARVNTTSPYPRFAAANALLLAWTVVASLQPWVADNDTTEQIARKYLPFALVLASIGTAVVARQLPRDRARAFLMRHFAVYLVVPLLLFAASRTTDTHARPEVGAIYLIAFGAWALHALEGLWHVIANLTDRAGSWLIAAVLLVPYLALMPYERLVQPTASDEPHYLIMVQSLIGDHDLNLKNEYDDETYRVFYDSTLPDRHIIHVGDAQYPIRDLGLPALLVIPFAIDGRSGALVFMCLVAAALAAQLYRTIRELGVTQRPAMLAVAAAGLMHPLLAYTTQIYPELPAALVFLLACRLLRRGRAASLAELACASALLGTLPWLSTRAWLIALGVGLIIAYCAWRPVGPISIAKIVARTVAGAAPFVALVLLLAYADWLMFRLFIPNAGYYVIRDQQQVLAFTPQVGVLGLLFDKAFGLIPRTPLFLVCALGLVPLVRRARGTELAALGLGWLVYFVYIADIAYWWADGSPPSRYLVASLPFLVVLLAAGIERLMNLDIARGLAIAIAWGLAAYSLFISFVYAVLPNLRYDLAVDVRGSGSPGSLFEFAGRVLRPNPATLFPSLVDARASDLLVGGIWAIVVIAVVVAGARERTRTTPIAA